MNLNDFKTSKFLTKEDVGEGILVTIKSIDKQNVAQEGADPEYKPCIHFVEVAKPLVCNSTNAQLIAQVTGSDDNIEGTWPGKQIVLYTDPNVSFGGKLIGGIRVRAPKGQKPASDLPF